MASFLDDAHVSTRKISERQTAEVLDGMFEGLRTLTVKDPSSPEREAGQN